MLILSQQRQIGRNGSFGFEVCKFLESWYKISILLQGKRNRVPLLKKINLNSLNTGMSAPSFPPVSTV